MAEIAVSELEDYESLPVHNLYVHLMAGAVAGLVEHCVMYPIDSVKTRLQSLCPCPERKCRGPVSGLIGMVQREGWWRPMRGMSAIASGSIPAHALYFTVYEKTKLWLTNGRSGHYPLAFGLSGCVATVVHDAVMNPAEVIKQRMQMWQSPYRGCTQCARCLLSNEGLCAFYRSFSTQLLMNIPFQTVHFMVYEFWQQTLNPRRKYDPMTHLFAGALAGGVAAAVTTPMDVVKTVLNTQQTTAVGERPCPVSFPGIRDAIRSISFHRGFAGFFSGIHARILTQMPATALAWSVYELFKHVLSLRETPPPSMDLEPDTRTFLLEPVDRRNIDSSLSLVRNR